MNFTYAIGSSLFPHKGLKIPTKLEDSIKKIRKVLIGLTIGDSLLSTGALLTGVFIVLGGTLLNLFAFGIALKVAAIALFTISTLFFASTIFGVVKIAIKSKKLKKCHPSDTPLNAEELKNLKKIKKLSDKQLTEQFNKNFENFKPLKSSNEDYLKKCKEYVNYIKLLVMEIIRRIEKNNNENLKKNFSTNSQAAITIFEQVEIIKLFEKAPYEVVGNGYLILLDILKYCNINECSNPQTLIEIIKKLLTPNISSYETPWIITFLKRESLDAQEYKVKNSEKFKKKFLEAAKNLSSNLTSLITEKFEKFEENIKRLKLLQKPLISLSLCNKNFKTRFLLEQEIEQNNKKYKRSNHPTHYYFEILKQILEAAKNHCSTKKSKADAFPEESLNSHKLTFDTKNYENDCKIYLSLNIQNFDKIIKKIRFENGRPNKNINKDLYTLYALTLSSFKYLSETNLKKEKAFNILKNFINFFSFRLISNEFKTMNSSYSFKDIVEQAKLKNNDFTNEQKNSIKFSIEDCLKKIQ